MIQVAKIIYRGVSRQRVCKSIPFHIRTRQTPGRPQSLNSGCVLHRGRVSVCPCCGAPHGVSRTVVEQLGINGWDGAMSKDMLNVNI
jgi:hypothetical protein